MLSTPLINDLNSLKIFESIYKLYEQAKLLLKIKSSSHADDSAYISYLKAAITKGGKVALVGAHKKEDLFFIRRLIGASGKLIAIADELHHYTVVADMVHILQWKNVLVEKVDINDFGCFYTNNDANRNGAIVVQFNKEPKRNTEATHMQSLTNYFAKNVFKPDVIKLNLKGNEYSVLFHAREFLQQHKPVVIVECDHRFADKSIILQTFKMLTSLHYRGFFFLDSLKISIRNFDFNIYQNASKDFYCSTFVFE